MRPNGCFSLMKKGDEIRRKDNHSVIARVNNVRRKFIPGYGLVTEVEIFNGMGMSWVPMKPWEVIKGDQTVIEWQKYNADQPPQEGKVYLVYASTFWYENGKPYFQVGKVKWVDILGGAMIFVDPFEDDRPIEGVAYYAEIQAPE